MENTPLQIEIQNIGTTTLIIPLGDIDISKSTELRNAIHPVIQEAPKRVVVDLCHVPYMDSSGVATLIEGLQLSKQSNIEFTLCSMSEGVRSIIELARLDQIFSIFDTREDALAE